MAEFALACFMAPFLMVIAIVGLVQAGRTARHWMDWRMRMAERRLELGSPTVRAAIDELRREVASMKQRETEAVFSFDSSVERLAARIARLEQRAVPHTPAGGALGTSTARSNDGLPTADSGTALKHASGEHPNA